MSWAYRKDQEAPALTLTWKDYTGAVRDFSSGYTFTAKVALATAPTTIVLSKTTGITGAATAPNITVDWSTSADRLGQPRRRNRSVQLHLQRTSLT